MSETPQTHLPSFYRVTHGTALQCDFHAGQRLAWKSRARFVCVLSGTQGGKTTFGPPWLQREIKWRGPGDYLVAAPTYRLLYVKALPEFCGLFENAFQLGRFISQPVKRFEFSPSGLQALFGKRFLHKPTTVFFGHAYGKIDIHGTGNARQLGRCRPG